MVESSHEPTDKTPKNSRAPSNNTTANGVKTSKISNVVTKFSFATKGGIAAHNPYKTN